MGIESYLIASTVKGVLAQRLVRRLCEHCKTPMEIREQWRQKLSAEKLNPKTERLSSPRGCQHCKGLGYLGRSTIAELLIMDEKIQRLICEHAPDKIVEESARANGMLSLYQSGMRKAWRGETSVEEVMRVTQAE
jgi:general secretion pathway protein E